MLGATTDELPEIAIASSDHGITVRAEDQPRVIELIRRGAPESRAHRPRRPLLLFCLGGQLEEYVSGFAIEPTLQDFRGRGRNALPISPLHARIAIVAEQEADDSLFYLFWRRGTSPREQQRFGELRADRVNEGGTDVDRIIARAKRRARRRKIDETSHESGLALKPRPHECRSATDSCERKAT